MPYRPFGSHTPLTRALRLPGCQPLPGRTWPRYAESGVLLSASSANGCTRRAGLRKRGALRPRPEMLHSVKHPAPETAMLNRMKHRALAALRAGMLHTVKPQRMLHTVKHRPLATLRAGMLDRVKHRGGRNGIPSLPPLLPLPFAFPLFSQTLITPFLFPFPTTPPSLGIRSRKSRPRPQLPRHRDGFEDFHQATTPLLSRSLRVTRPARNGICATGSLRSGRCGFWKRRKRRFGAFGSRPECAERQSGIGLACSATGWTFFGFCRSRMISSGRRSATPSTGSSPRATGSAKGTSPRSDR